MTLGRFGIIICCLALNGFRIVFSRDYYDILGVQHNADIKKIKSAYRSAAMKLHPDKNPDDPEAAKRFQDLSDAYKILSDPKKREVYDISGEEGVKKMDSEDGFDEHGPFSSFFGDFFGGGSDKRNEEETPKGANIDVDLYATLEEVYKGDFVEIRRKKSVYKKTSGTRECNCRVEMRTQQLGAGRYQMFQEKVCSQCSNMKLVTVNKNLEVEIEAGSDDGHEQRFVSDGEPHIEGDPGDLIFKLRIHKHKTFERRGLDLYTNVTISLQQALAGFEMDIEHLDGHKVHVTRDKVTWPGARIRKKDEGMPMLNNNKVKGILYVTFDIEFPRGEFTAEQKTMFAQLLKQENYKIKVYNGLQGF